ncbi:MAG: putative DNA binding domain-containing protein, partial [Promicromonosporaceae bacterium]|nr:putative DNA binding domain-containing protein [Promicromonosporaceae bacterium]
MTLRDSDVLWAESPDEAAEELLNQVEDQWFDRKSGRVSAAALAIPLVAFANSEGGTIAVGFHSGKVDGISDKSANELRQAAIDFTNPPVRHKVIEFTTTRGERVMLFQVFPGEHAHETAKGECYLRVGDESRKLDFISRRELEYDRGSAPFDGTRVNVPVNDLSDKRVLEYQLKIGAQSRSGALEARDLLTRDGTPTVAAWLLFADHPQSLFPSANVRILKYMDNIRGTGSSLTLASDGDVRLDGPLPDQIEKASRQI